MSRSVNSSVSEISLDKLRSGRDSLIRSAKRSFYPRKQSRNRSIPTLASFECDPFGIRFNVTLDGCCSWPPLIKMDESVKAKVEKTFSRTRVNPSHPLPEMKAGD